LNDDRQTFDDELDVERAKVRDARRLLGARERDARAFVSEPTTTTSTMHTRTMMKTVAEDAVATDAAVPTDADLMVLFDKVPEMNNNVWDDVFAQHNIGGMARETHEQFQEQHRGQCAGEHVGEHFPAQPQADEFEEKFDPRAHARGVVARMGAATKPRSLRVVKPRLKIEDLPSQPVPVAKARSSQYNGVCRHAKSGRFEAHVWLRESRRQVYLGGHVEEEFAAEAFDIIVLKLARMGSRSKSGSRPLKMNFPESRYANLIGYIDSVSLDELIMEVRRHSEGFARSSSGYRGVTRHANSKFEARLGVPRSHHMYLGLFDSAEKAAVAYDNALVRVRGRKASTNFPLYNYTEAIAYYERTQRIAQR